MVLSRLLPAQRRAPGRRARGRRPLLAAACLAVLPLAGAAASPDDAALRAVVADAVRPLMARFDVPGMSVAVTTGGRARVFHFGVAGRASGRPVDDDTLFEIGSVSKTFTATLATWAEATGRLSLDDHPLGWPHHRRRGAPPGTGRPLDRATLRQLGTYTAGGLPLQFPDEVETPAQVLAFYRDWRPEAEPGRERRYSNPSLGLFGHLAAMAWHEDFDHAMEARLFPAFGLAHTWIHVPPAQRDHYAWGYRGAEAVRVRPGPLDDETYGVKTTAADLIRFVQAQIDPSALAPELRRAVEATHVGVYRAGPLVQGLGWEQYPWPLSKEWLLGGNAAEMIEGAQPVMPVPAGPPAGERLLDKTGSTGGFGAYVAFVPARRIGLVMLANRNLPIPARVEAAWTILQALAGQAGG